MSELCLACEAPLAISSAHCGRCGFPVALTGAAVIGLGRKGFPEPSPREEVRGATAPVHLDSPLPDPEEAAITHFAHELRGAFELIREMNGETNDVLGELRQAALLHAEGSTSNTLSVVRNAERTATGRVSELFDRRLGELEEREHLLVHQGISEEIAHEPAQIRTEFAQNSPRAAIAHLTDADRRFSDLEQQWDSLRSVLADIDQVRLASRKFGVEVPSAESEVAAIRAPLARGGVPPGEVPSMAARAREAYRSFQQAVSSRMQEELDHHAAELARFRVDHAGGRRARQMHAEATRHLRSGRLAEATLRLTELREAVEAAAREPEGPSAAPAERPEVTLAALLERARKVAARIKLLPTDSPLASSAATQIRLATEQLRKRELEAAGRTLTELMHSLDAAGGHREA